jgi:hypothetical protein
MKKIFLLTILFTIFTSVFTGCIQNGKSLGQQEALEIAWDTLKPNTISRNRDYWEIHEARKVYGKDVVAEFSSVQKMTCPGPLLPENKPIKISTEYWYIKVVPHPEVMRKVEGTDSGEKVAIVPEPTIEEAAFLIDIYGGEVIARRLLCIASQ